MNDTGTVGYGDEFGEADVVSFFIGFYEFEHLFIFDAREFFALHFLYDFVFAF